ncbi:hypothetical protein H1C71_042242 [Ictidomys tridecemlineatus]|nr:hypothetical protein H1C71_042242 [Ictidomys tridecemlineatus]
MLPSGREVPRLRGTRHPPGRAGPGARRQRPRAVQRPVAPERRSMGRRCSWRRRALVAAGLGAALLLLLLLCALRPAFENTSLGSIWLRGEKKSPLQLLYDLDQPPEPLG